LDLFTIGIRPPALNMRGSRSTEDPDFQSYLLLYFLSTFCSSRLPVRFDGVLGGLADLKTTYTCSSPTGLFRRRSRAY
jgi:hypothetical protein